jgi:hypothetical protein
MTKHGVTITLMGGICALALAVGATPASAQAYLSHVGTGSTCTLAQPCANMSNALNAAGPGGEVICLDKGTYSNSNIPIAQSVTISCGDGLWESPRGQLTITTPAGSDVIIEGLVSDGTGVTGSVIVMTGQGALHLRRVRAGNVTGIDHDGLKFQPNGPATLDITDSVFYHNSSLGILIQPTGSGTVNVVLNRVQIESNVSGVTIDGTGGSAQIQVQIKDSVITNNTSTGVSAQSGTGLIAVSISNTHSVGNQTGVSASGSQAVVILDRTTVMANTVQAISVSNGAAVFSYGNNPINDNGALGTSPTVIGLH